MNKNLKSILLTILTLSVFVIALVELSGVSSTALFNKYGIGNGGAHVHDEDSEEAKKERESKVAEMPRTTIQFEDTKHSFGNITEGEVVKHAYKFTNTGNNPLLISNAVASCGCTVPNYPKEPIPPGGSGEIVVVFNSTGRPGHQQKNVLIYSNAQQDAMSIGFDAEVEKK